MGVDVVSLGCRLNISESEEMRGMLAGAENLVVVNSCAVTSEAVRRTRQAIRRIRRARPDARLVVTGCAAEIERDTLAAMPEVNGLVPNAAKLDPRAWNVAPSVARSARHHTRAFVQVQNGCDHACTFCVIPRGRGASRSLPTAEVLAMIGRQLDLGLNEVVLTGVDLTSWGTDLPGNPRLGKLCEAILATYPTLPRLRLSSIDGAEVDDALFDLVTGEQRMMPHLHLSLQSGDDMVLKRMKRRHSRAEAIALAGRLRARRPEITIGADLIAGFPTEDEAMHANSLAIVGEIGVVHGHVFPYSPRPGTPAARMPQVASPTIRRRAAELREAVAHERSQWLASLVGKPLSVLAEADGTGHCAGFAPVRLPAGTVPGSIVTIVPTCVEEGLLA